MEAGLGFLYLTNTKEKACFLSGDTSPRLLHRRICYVFQTLLFPPTPVDNIYFIDEIIAESVYKLKDCGSTSDRISSI